MPYAVGVDLGTTYTAAAVAVGDRADIVPLSHRAPQVRSAAHKPAEGPMVFGDVAVRHLVPEPQRTATEFKRRIGDPTDLYLGGTPMSALALSKGLLRSVLETVVRGQGGPPASLTVACPANWGPHRRELMEQVINLSPDYPAGLCTEPEAAGAHYAMVGRMAAGDVVAVYDLGGGTFDAAVLRRTEHGFATLGPPAGDELLGGFELDGAVLNHVVESVGREWFDPDDDAALETLARLRLDCTEAREALSTELEVAVPVVLGARRTSVRLTRQEFEGLIRERVEESVGTLERVIAAARVTPADLTAVLLVGGTAQTPLVSEIVSSRLQVPVVLEPQPKLCVALGAALIGAQRTRPASPAPPPRPRAPVPATTAAAAAPGRTAATPAPHPGPPGRAATGTGKPKAPAGRTTTRATVGTPVLMPRASAGASAVEASARSRLPWYRIAAPVLLLLALVLALQGPERPGTSLVWDENYLVTPAKPVGRGATLQPTFASREVLDPTTARNGRFDLGRYKAFLGGPLAANLSGVDPSEVVLRPEKRFDAGRLVSVQGGLMVLTGLFSFAYIESLVRSLRRKGRAVAAAELVGLAGAGAVAGIALVLCGWVVAARLLEVGIVIAVVVCSSAAVGLLAFGWDRSSRART